MKHSLQLEIFNGKMYRERTVSLRRFSEYAVATPFERPQIVKAIISEWMGTSGGPTDQQRVYAAYFHWVRTGQAPDPLYMEHAWTDWMSGAFNLMTRHDRLCGCTEHEAKNVRRSVQGIVLKASPDGVFEIEGRVAPIKFWLYADRRGADVLGQVYADSMHYVLEATYKEPLCILVDVFGGSTYRCSRPDSAVHSTILATASQLRNDWAEELAKMVA